MEAFAIIHQVTELMIILIFLKFFSKVFFFLHFMADHRTCLVCCSSLSSVQLLRALPRLPQCKAF